MDEQIARAKRLIVGGGVNLTACTVAAVLMDGVPEVQAVLAFLAAANLGIIVAALWPLRQWWSA